MDLYGEIILDHFHHPRQAKLLEDADLTSSGNNPLCGDRVTVTLKTDSDGKITAFGFEGEGCAISIASTSLLGEKLIGRTLSEIAEMPEQQVLDLLGIPISPGRIKCAMLGYNCLKKAALQRPLLDLLNQVIDPELGVGIVDLGLIYDVKKLPGGKVKVTMTLTSMTCPAGPQLMAGVEEVLKKNGKARDVEVELVWDPPWDPGKMNPQVRAILYGNIANGKTL